MHLGSGMREVFLLAIFAIALLCSAGAVRARDTALQVHGAQQTAAGRDNASPLSVSLTRKRISHDQGREKVTTAESARPGDVLEETATYTNVSKRPLRVTEATLPVPPDTTFQVGSASPANVYASVDGTNYERVPLRAKYRRADGTVTESDIPVEEYRFLRWLPGELGPGQSVSFSARFKIAGDPTLARQRSN